MKPGMQRQREVEQWIPSQARLQKGSLVPNDIIWYHELP